MAMQMKKPQPQSQPAFTGQPADIQLTETVEMTNENPEKKQGWKETVTPAAAPDAAIKTSRENPQEKVNNDSVVPKPSLADRWRNMAGHNRQVAKKALHDLDALVMYGTTNVYELKVSNENDAIVVCRCLHEKGVYAENEANLVRIDLSKNV